MLHLKYKILDVFRKSILSVDIGSRNIKIVEGKYHAGKVLINNAIIVSTPLGTLYDGKIVEGEKIEQAVSEVLKRENIKTKNVVFTLESAGTISREIVLPWTKSRELEQIIGFEAEQHLPVKLDKYILQYKIINKFEEEGVRKVTVLVVALPKLISEDYFNLGKNMGLIPYYLDTHSNAIHKLLSSKTVVNDSYSLVDQTIAVIDLGHQFINVTVINRGQFEFSRLLNNGGEDVDMGIDNLFNLSLEEAEIRKKEAGDVSRGTKPSNSTMLTDMVRETITGWLEEIQKIFRYYTSRDTSNVIDSICIYGGGSNIEGISIYFQKFLNIPTFKINSLNNVKFNNNLEEISISSFVNAIGAVIRK